MSTTWWAASITSEQDWVEFDEAVDDVHWVVDQILDLLENLPAPTPPSLSEISQNLPSSSRAGWMARTDGKRQLKSTELLLEGGGFNDTFLHCTIEHYLVPTHYARFSCATTSCRG